MKISKGQLKKIINEERSKMGIADFGSNSQRISEMRGVDRGVEPINTAKHTPKQSAESQLNWIDNFSEAWVRHADEDPDPRLEEIEELYFALSERLHAILEDRE